MKDNVTVLSWCNADNVMNYGQILQAISMMIITREETDKDINYISYHPRTLKNKVRCFIERHNFINGHLIPYYQTNHVINKIVKENRVKLFQVANYDKLVDLSEETNLMICGSDQIWHPRNYDPGYFLNFGSDKIKRASYAASLPKTNIEEQFNNVYPKIEKSLSRFDMILVREKGSIDFIKKLSNKNTEWVLDPTLLVGKEYWNKLKEETNEKEEKYIFVYIPNGIDDDIEKEIKKLQNKLDIEKVIILMTRGNQKFKQYKTIKYVSIGHFLSLIDNASFIYTSSFHAVVFSLIFQKNFLCHEVQIEEQGEDIRLYDLLKNVNLLDRLSIGACKNKNIDYESVNVILNSEIDRSRKIFSSIFE